MLPLKRGIALRAHLPSRLPYQPWSVLVPLVVVEWLGLAVEAHRVDHNGWLFGNGRGETLYYTTSWLLGGGDIAHALVGYGMPVLLAPVSWIAGANLLSALPLVVVLQVVLLLPATAFGAYVLGARSGGRLIGYLAAAAWTLGPFASTWYFELHTSWRDQVVPELLGLTARPELPATALLLLAGVLVLRALDERRLVDAAAAGAFASFAVAIQPSNVLFLVAPPLAFLTALRLRELAAFAAALVPATLTYLLWSERGSGQVSLLLPHHDFSWALLKLNWTYLQTSSWSPRVLEWIAVAGFVALLKRAPAKALFFGAWLGAYALAEGASPGLRAEHAPFWHLLMPAFPAFCALTASLPLLWPRAERRLPERFPYRPARLVPLAGPAALVLVVPLVALVAASPLHARDAAVGIPRADALVPLRGPRATVRAGGDRVTLSWPALGDQRATIAYAVYRSEAGRDLACTTRGATGCELEMKWIGTTRTTSFSEPRGRGASTYRVGVIASTRGVTGKPLVLLGPPAVVR